MSYPPPEVYEQDRKRMYSVIKAGFCLIMFILSLLVSAVSALLLFVLSAVVAVISFAAVLACVPLVVTLVISVFAVDSSGEYLGVFDSEEDE